MSRTAEQASPGADVVLVGATTLLGEEVRRQLARRRFPVRHLVMMGEGEEVGQIVDYDGEARLVTELDDDVVERSDLLFLGSRGQIARRALTALRRGRGVAIDLVDSEASGKDPIVNMEINSGQLPTRRPARVRSPHPVVQTLSSTLATVAGRSRLIELVATVLTPASDSGKAGVEELYQQTAAVLNFETKPEKVFQRQLAFNVVPHAFMHVQQGWPDLDARLQGECVQVLGLQAKNVAIRSILTPVFHGFGIMASARFEPLVKREARRRRLRAAPFHLGPITPADLEESEDIHIADLGDEPGGRLGLWIVADNLRCSGALNGVRIAEAVMAGGQT